MSEIIGTIESGPIWLDRSIANKPRIWFIADLDMDGDGPNGNPWGDPDWQNATTLRNFDGTSCDCEKDALIVVPPLIIDKVPEIVMGCQAQVTWLNTGVRRDAVVGDQGPTKKDGEGSVELGRRFGGMNPSPVDGGEDDRRMVLYELWPGEAALVGYLGSSKAYPLQAS